MRDYFCTDSPNVLAALAEAVTRADMNGQRFRISVEGGVLKYKVGEGMWTAPIQSSNDPYRDGV